MAAMSVGRTGTSEFFFKVDTLRMIAAKFGSNWFSGFREEDF